MNKKVVKRFLAMALTASMIIPSVPARAEAAAADGEPSVLADDGTGLTPYYDFTFDLEGDTNIQVTNAGSKEGAVAKIEGDKEGLGIVYDEQRASKVLNLPGGSTAGKTESRLTLPENMFADVTDAGFAFSFWINIDPGAGEYARIFSGTVEGQNSNTGWPWEAPEFSFVAGSDTATYTTTIMLSDKTSSQPKWDTVFARGQWQHVMLSVSPTAYDVYIDGTKITYSGDMSSILTKLFENNAAELKKYKDCAIGASVYQTDADLKAKMDEFRFYNTALTAEQAKAVYDSYKVDDSVIAALQEQIDTAEAKVEVKSLSFYTRESYTELLSAIEAGKKGIENPTTTEYIENLTTRLENAIEGLTYYEGVTESTTFSNAQLEAENTAAKKILSDGGLTSETIQAIQTATSTADAALALEGETADNQAEVDAALKGLREVVDVLDETSLATPVISKQPIKAVYDLGDKVSKLTVEATLNIVGDEDKSLSYQWYQNTVKSTEGATAIEGETKSTYTPSIESIGKTYYYCAVTNTNPAIAGKSTVTNSNVVLIRVNSKDEVDVPQPYYEFTFDVTADDGKEVTNVGSKTGVKAEIEGDKEGLGVQWDDERASNVLNLPGGSTNGATEGRLSLPENMFADVTDAGFAFSFWINIDTEASQYSRIFSGTVNGQNSHPEPTNENKDAWDAPEFAFVAGKEGAGDLEDGGAGYHTAILLPDGKDDDNDGKADHGVTELKLVWEEQFAKGKWQHVTISVSPDKYDVYLDGELVGIKYDRKNNKSTVLQALFANNAAILKQYTDCAIGASVYESDKDLKAKVDEFRFYNTALTMEQAEAAYDSYAVSKELVAQLQAKVTEAKAKSISFYKRDAYEALAVAIAAGETGIENPVTNANVLSLIAQLDEAIEALAQARYEGIAEDAAFSNLQLQKETEDAKDIFNAGGLTLDSDSTLSSAIAGAETALALDGTKNSDQAAVDAALKALRAAVDAVEYEDAAATPVIDDDGQPQPATYTKDNREETVEPLIVTATVTDKGNLSYQWYQNSTNSTTGGDPIEGEGANTASYTPVVGDVGVTYYYCEVTNTQTKATTTPTATAKSNVAAVTVKEVAEPVVATTSTNKNYQIGGTAQALTVTATVSDEGTLTYQWYKAETEDGTGEVIANENEASYTPSTGTLGKTYYYCVVTNTIGTAEKKAESKRISINVVENLDMVAEEPTITKEPEDANYTVGDTVQPLTVEATVDDEGTLSYQWYQKATEDAEGEAIKDATSASYTPDISTEGTTYYYCAVTNTKGEGETAVTATATSKVVKVTVTQGSVITKPEAATPSITAQPVAATYTYGQTAKALTVAASVSDKGTLSYQWYKNTSNKTEGATAINGATAAAYTPAVTAAGTVYYYCVVTNTKDSKTAETTSDVAAIKVNKAASSITGVSNVTTTFGKSVTLKAKGKGTVTYKSSNTKVLAIGTTNGKIKTVGYGKAQVTITAAGDSNYNGATKKITVTVKPKKMTVSSAKSTKKKTLTVKWKKDAKADGYKVQYSTDKKFKKSVKTATVKKGKTVKTTLKKLKAGKKYYVRICAYKGSGKNQVCGDWSKAKTAKVKK